MAVLRSIFLAAALFGASASAQSAPPWRLDVDRPGHTYETAPAQDAAACAARCAGDGFCRAWSLSPARACALKMAAGAAQPAPGFASGLSARAERRDDAAEPPPPPTSLRGYASDDPIVAAAYEEMAAFDEQTLLGGPEDEH
ncbi:MAG: PAN domain-containing protein [Hyphomonadaceae bacterium]|nr:PAN domain-containing protein [Hyphomonadaceae bacterium]